ncbi:unnamed protein product [Spirodela intermedia]|uniref:Uncharacterized protein n=2 Tax=Spirodela intermedia TaxID=51605 RepID=A0A7I8K2N8_SPIIN|nr:unnamed protein product [Spirodela intermedia]CAA6655437.1 unnamed protein product [Spirodela intermedia]CAA7390693.1 unnamed protein product [Spirodela intermedia]
MFTPSRASRRRALRSSWEEALSKPEVGSSRISKEGSITISNPTPSDSITLSTTKTLSALDKSSGSLREQDDVSYLHLALNQRFSSTVKFPCTTSSCGTKPIIFL